MNPHSYAHVIYDKVAKKYDGEKTASSTNVPGKSSISLQKTETRYMFSTLYYYQLKMDQGTLISDPKL
jgi:hypothetical protein